MPSTRTETTIEILKAADVDTRGISMAFRKGFASEECRNVASRALEDIDKIARFGINAGSGYSKDMKKALSDLAEIVEDAAEEKNRGPAAERKLDAKRAGIVGGLKMPSLENANKAKNLALRYIDGALDAIPTLKRNYPDADGLYAASEQIFTALRDRVQSVHDGSTSSALDKADRINKIVREWRRNSEIITAARVEKLQGACEIVGEWELLYAPLAKNNKIRDDDERLTYHSDNLDNNISEASDSLNALKKAVKKYDNGLEKKQQEENADLDREYDRYSGEITENEDRIEKIESAVRNGRINNAEERARVMREVQDLEKAIAESKTEREKVEMRRRRRAAYYNKRRDVVRAIRNNIIQPLEDAKEGNPTLFRTITEGPSSVLAREYERLGISTEPINFAAVLDLVHNNCDNNALAHIMLQIKNIKLAMDVEDENYDAFIKQIEQMEGISDEIKAESARYKDNVSSKREERESSNPDEWDKFWNRRGITVGGDAPLASETDGEKARLQSSDFDGDL